MTDSACHSGKKSFDAVESIRNVVYAQTPGWPKERMPKDFENQIYKFMIQLTLLLYPNRQ